MGPAQATAPLAPIAPERVPPPPVQSPPAPALKLAQPPAAASNEVHAQPASLWRRAAATLIDATILLAVVGGYLWVASKVAGIGTAPTSHRGLDAIAYYLQAWKELLLPGALLAGVIGVAYSAVFSLLWSGRTPGRGLLGVRLVDATGQSPRPARAVVRALLSVVSFALLLAGFWLALFDRRGQTLHDKLTGTFVVRLAR